MKKNAMYLCLICFISISYCPSSRALEGRTKTLEQLVRELEPNYVPKTPRYFKNIPVSRFLKTKNGIDFKMMNYPVRLVWHDNKRGLSLNGVPFSTKTLFNEKSLEQTALKVTEMTAQFHFIDLFIEKAHARKRTFFQRAIVDFLRCLRSRIRNILSFRPLKPRNSFRRASFEHGPVNHIETTVTDRANFQPASRDWNDIATPRSVEVPRENLKTQQFGPDSPSADSSRSSLCPSGYERHACRVVELTNGHRSSMGRPPLRVSQGCTRVAKDHAVDMTQNGFFSHQSPSKGGLSLRTRGLGFTSAGENIARGQTTPESVMRDWISSPGHNRNLLDRDFTHIGVAKVGNDWVQCFSREK